MAEKAKHAYGSRANLEAAIQAGKVDSFDVLFLNGENETPAMGWVTKDGEPIIIEQTDLSGVEAEIATKADAEDVTQLETQLATKVTADEVDAKITEALDNFDVEEVVEEKMVAKVEEAVAASNAYTDAKIAEIESAASYEIIEF